MKIENELTNDEMKKTMMMLELKVLFESWSEALIMPNDHEVDAEKLFSLGLKALIRPFYFEYLPQIFSENYSEELDSSIDDIPDKGCEAKGAISNA